MFLCVVCQVSKITSKLVSIIKTDSATYLGVVRFTALALALMIGIWKLIGC